MNPSAKQKTRMLERSVVDLGSKVRSLEADYKAERDQRIKLQQENEQLRERIITLTK